MEEPYRKDLNEAMSHAIHEFQRIVRRDKKAFFSEQCFIIEENNKRGKTRDFFRKIGNIKAAFRQKMDTIKDKNGSDLVD